MDGKERKFTYKRKPMKTDKLPIIRYGIGFPTCREADILDDVVPQLNTIWPELATKKGWYITHLSIIPNWVELSIDVPADVSPWKVATAFKREAAAKIFNVAKKGKVKAHKRWPLPSMWTRALIVRTARVMRTGTK